MLLLCALCVRDSDVTDMRRDRGAFSLSLFIPSLTYPNRFGAMRGAMVPHLLYSYSVGKMSTNVVL